MSYDTPHTHSHTHTHSRVSTPRATCHDEAPDIIGQRLAKLTVMGNIVVIAVELARTEYSPSDLFKIEFTSWLLALALAASLFPDMRTPGRILVLERGLQIVQRHLLVKHGRYGARQWRHNPDPICGTAVAKTRGEEEREIERNWEREGEITLVAAASNCYGRRFVFAYCL